MINFIEALQYDIVRNAVIAGLLASIACGVVGTLIVVKRLVFITGGISHASFGGVGLAIYKGFDPLLGAGLFALLSAMGVGAAGAGTLKREDTAIGILWVIGMALGSFFMYFSDGYATNLSSYLFGSLTLISETDIYYLLALDVVVLLFAGLLYRQLQALCFDEEFARVTGIPATALYFVLLGLSAITVVLLIRFVGIILVIALITIPAAIAIQFSHRMNRIMVASTFMAAVFTVGGLWASYELDWVVGPTIVLLAGGAFVTVTALKKGWSAISKMRSKGN